MPSTIMMEKLGLPVLEHPGPYILYSLENLEFKDMADIFVTKQVRISFMLEEYEGEVLCDVVPSKMREFLLRLSWHIQNQTKHDHLINTYSFLFKSRPIVLVTKENDEN